MPPPGLPGVCNNAGVPGGCIILKGSLMSCLEMELGESLALPHKPFQSIIVKLKSSQRRKVPVTCHGVMRSLDLLADFRNLFQLVDLAIQFMLQPYRLFCNNLRGTTFSKKN
jgi:hypothetical protein